MTRVPPPDPRGRVQALSAVPGVLWVADTGAGAIRRFDLASGRYDLAVTAPAPRNLAAGADGAYVVTDLNQLLSRVDARTGRRSAPIPLRHLGGVRGVAVGPGAVWVTTGDQVVLVDPRPAPTPHRRLAGSPLGPAAQAIPPRRARLVDMTRCLAYVYLDRCGRIGGSRFAVAVCRAWDDR